ncbi:hypothetical protein ACFE04_026727 [Oxalis oulophora]
MLDHKISECLLPPVDSSGGSNFGGWLRAGEVSKGSKFMSSDSTTTTAATEELAGSQLLNLNQGRSRDNKLDGDGRGEWFVGQSVPEKGRLQGSHDFGDSLSKETMVPALVKATLDASCLDGPGGDDPEAAESKGTEDMSKSKVGLKRPLSPTNKERDNVINSDEKSSGLMTSQQPIHQLGERESIANRTRTRNLKLAARNKGLANGDEMQSLVTESLILIQVIIAAYSISPFWLSPSIVFYGVSNGGIILIISPIWAKVESNLSVSLRPESHTSVVSSGRLAFYFYRNHD